MSIAVWILVGLVACTILSIWLAWVLNQPGLLGGALLLFFAVIVYVGIGCVEWWCEAEPDERQRLAKMLPSCPDTQGTVQQHLDTVRGYLTAMDVQHFKDMCLDERFEKADG
ncbi:hypothetical protein [Salinisphaera orenii]|uniref:hypothetical protein n=1 Tax=Salinisphaera orenii TaxID=856731 RepID=UPI000DBE6641